MGWGAACSSGAGVEMTGDGNIGADGCDQETPGRGGSVCGPNGSRTFSAGLGCARNVKSVDAAGGAIGRGSAGIGIVIAGGAVTGNVETGRFSESFWRSASRRK